MKKLNQDHGSLEIQKSTLIILIFRKGTLRFLRIFALIPFNLQTKNLAAVELERAPEKILFLKKAPEK